MFVSFGAFIVACGATHLMDVWTLWTPLFWLSADLKIITAVASVATAVALPPLVPKVLHLLDEIRVSDERRTALLHAQRDLEDRVQGRTAELASALEREQGLRAAAEAASQAKEEFLAIVSHELRTPLNAILGWSEMLQRRDVDAAKQGRGLQAIARNARAQAQVVADLLDMARISSGKLALTLQECDLVPIVSAAVETVRPSAQARKVSVRLDVRAAAVLVHGDPARLQQVVWNLLSNAIKFTPAGGGVEVAVDRAASHAVVEVRDTGVGIAPEFLPNAFERFTQADSSSRRAHGGLGLGLAIVRHLVELHRGAVTAESPGPGRGSTLRVTLPAVSRAPRPEEAPRAAVHEQPLTGYSVLVVDDDFDSRQIVGAILEHAGAHAIGAASVTIAMAVLQRQRVDAVVCDIGMPEIDGYGFIDRLRESPDAALRRIPVAALSGYAAEADRRSMREAGFAIHLSKPVMPDDLVQAVLGLVQFKE
jgi:signal transduction histidine kinase/CheY-like chemotaxis protein